MSLWQPVTHRRGQCCRPHGPYQSFLQSFLMPSVPNWLDSLARPGGNATGFTSFGYDIGGKWLELLKEIAPRVTRVAVLRDSALTAGVGQWSAIQTAAPSFGMEAIPINLSDARELERAISRFAHPANGGLIVTCCTAESAIGTKRTSRLLRRTCLLLGVKRTYWSCRLFYPQRPAVARKLGFA